VKEKGKAMDNQELDVIEYGKVTSPAAAGTNVLNDNTKNWAVDVHRNRLVKIFKGAGSGQLFPLQGNGPQALVIRGTWTLPLDTTSEYAILSLDLAQVIRDVLGGGVDVDLPAEFTAIIAAIGGAVAATDIIDRWARQLGQIDIARVLGATLAHANPVIMRLTDGAAFIDPRDVSDRAARLLGVIYGSQAQQLLQRAATFDLLIQLRHAGLEIDPRAIRALTATDIITVQSLTQWGGVALTGRDISLDLARLDVNLSTRATEATLGKLIPVAKAVVFNTALPATDNDILGSAITPTNSPSYLQIYVCVAIAGILRVRRTQGGVTISENLNDGQNLNANASYSFTVPWRTGDNVNFWYSQTGGNILSLIVDEIGGG
jgi:hypothetical protein